ncbi:biotin synthase, partial [Acinetobacter baumannii]
EGKDQALFNKLGLTAEKPKPTVSDLSVDAMSA